MDNYKSVVVYQCTIITFLVGICFGADPRPLNQEEKDRLGAAWDKNNTRLSSSIDITYSKKTIHSARLAEARRKSNQQKTQEIRQSLNKPEIEVKSFGMKTSGNEEEFYSHSQIQIKDPSRYREDVIIYVDEKKEESHYDAVHINNNETSFKIDKKRKLVTYDDKYRWGAGRDTLAYGTFFAHNEIGLDIFGLRFSHTKTREFRHKGLVEVAGNDAVSIELVDLKNEKPVYEIFLDVNDWSKLYKCILYNKDGTAVTKISEFSKFAKGGEGKVYYPHLIIQQQFDAEGKEKSRDVIHVEEVSVGLSIPDDVFELNVSDEYQIINSSTGSSAAESP